MYEGGDVQVLDLSDQCGMLSLVGFFKCPPGRCFLGFGPSLIHNLFPIDDALACQTIQDFQTARSSFVFVSQFDQIRFPLLFPVETL